MSTGFSHDDHSFCHSCDWFGRFDLLFIYSANHCDIDDDGVQHLVFCRVIMGNMELLHPGSRQFHPSSKDFDSGVDDLTKPTYYVVWRMNMNSHIYPESIVRFRVASSPKGDNLLWVHCLIGRDNYLILVFP